MSPVKQTAPRSVAIAIVTALAGVVGVVALIVFVFSRTGDAGQVEVRLGSERFEAGPALERAAAIDRDGPILLPDPGGGTRDIYLQHLGSEPTTGWLAFESRRPGAGRQCTLVWDARSETFSDPCGGEPVPADGAGLVQYVAVVDEGGSLVIDTRTGSG